jgi:hypothetical protein
MFQNNLSYAWLELSRPELEIKAEMADHSRRSKTKQTSSLGGFLKILSHGWPRYTKKDVIAKIYLNLAAKYLQNFFQVRFLQISNRNFLKTNKWKFDKLFQSENVFINSWRPTIEFFQNFWHFLCRIITFSDNFLSII